MNEMDGWTVLLVVVGACLLVVVELAGVGSQALAFGGW